MYFCKETHYAVHVTTDYLVLVDKSLCSLVARALHCALFISYSCHYSHGGRRTRPVVIIKHQVKVIRFVV